MTQRKTLLLFLISLCCYPLQSGEVPFVLNSYTTFNSDHSCRLKFSHNSIRNPLASALQCGDFDPVVKSGIPYNEICLTYCYKRSCISLGRYRKPTFHGGIYFAGSPDSIELGYDPLKEYTRTEITPYINISRILLAKDRVDVAISVEITSPFEEGWPFFTLIFSKSFNRFSYSGGIESPTSLVGLIPFLWPRIPFISISYTPWRKVALFVEGKNFISYYPEQFPDTFFSLIGARIDCFQTLGFSIYYCYRREYRRQSPYKLPFDLEDTRFGFQIDLRMDTIFQ